MVVVRHTGHAIQVFFLAIFHVDSIWIIKDCFLSHVRSLRCDLQEDVPDEFASLVLNFISRNRIGPHGVEVSFKINVK